MNLYARLIKILFYFSLFTQSKQSIMSSHSGFVSQSLDVWNGLISKESKGLQASDFLLNYFDKISLSPYHNQENTADSSIISFRAQHDWDIAQSFSLTIGNEKVDNKKLLEILNQGINLLWLKAHGRVNFEVLFQDIGLNYIVLVLEANSYNDPVFSSLHTYLMSNYPDVEISVFAYAPQDLIELPENPFPVCLDLFRLAHSGLSTLDVLSIGLCQLNDFWSQCSQRSIWVRLSATGDFYLDICQVRAYRQMLTSLAHKYQEQNSFYLVGETPFLNKTSMDLYSNMLRTSLEGLALALGGVDALFTHPYSEGFKELDEFALRMARNQSLIAMHEAKVSKIQDVAEGSYFFERFTKDLISQIAHRFMELEEQGGLSELISSGNLKLLAENQLNKTLESHIKGEKVLIGFNRFKPNDAQAFASDVDLGQTVGLSTYVLQDLLIDKI